MVILSATAAEEEKNGTHGRNIHTYRTIVFIISSSIHTNVVCLFALLLYFSLSFWMAKHRRRDRVRSPTYALSLSVVWQPFSHSCPTHTRHECAAHPTKRYYALFAFVLIVVFIFFGVVSPFADDLVTSVLECFILNGGKDESPTWAVNAAPLNCWTHPKIQ